MAITAALPPWVSNGQRLRVQQLSRRVNLVERPFRWPNDRLSQDIDDQISADFSVNQTLVLVGFEKKRLASVAQFRVFTHKGIKGYAASR